MIWNCKHDWKILDKTMLPSKMEELTRFGGGFKGTAFAVDFDDMCQKNLVLTCACTKCGKLEVIRESN
jgi:tRNA 2-selenouridine synthase SelU